jgi:hypothetical protein
MIKQIADDLVRRYAWPPEVHFDRRQAGPWGAIYTGPDDWLQTNVLTSVATTGLTIYLRYLTADGRMHYEQESLDGAALNTLTQVARRLSEGWLLGCAASNFGGGLGAGSTFVSVALQNNGPAIRAPHTLLAQGYVSNTQVVTWPAEIIPPTGGRTFSQFSASLAVGTDISFTVPAGKQWTPLLLIGTLVTSATVATRTVQVRFTDGTHTLFIDAGVPTQAASLTQTYSFSTSARFETTFTLNIAAYGFPGGVPLQPGWVIGTLTNAIQAGDQWTNVALVVAESPL